MKNLYLNLIDFSPRSRFDKIRTMNDCKHAFFLILTIVIALCACQTDPFAIKQRVNPNDDNFNPADISIISLSSDEYLSLDSPILIEWKKLTPKLTMINPSIWFYRNGVEYRKIKEVGENEVQGKTSINLIGMGFQHLDLCQVYFLQTFNGKKWIDSFERPILLYNPNFTPVFSQLQPLSVEKSAMKFRFSIIALGGGISEIGVCYNSTGNPTINSNTKIINPPYIDKNSYEFALTGLSANSAYYMRLYAKSQTGVIYGNTNQFKTIAPTKPVVSKPQVSNVTGSSVFLKSNLLDNGGSIISERGFVYNKMGSPTLSDNRVTSTDTNNIFSYEITGLDPLTKYYFSSYAINDAGTTISDVESITTLLPDKNCQISQQTTGKYYSIRIPTKTYFKGGESIQVSMDSPTYQFGQASTIRLYDGDTQVHSFGNWLVFSNNTRNLTLPTNLKSSNCYNIHVLNNAGDVYVTSKFTIIP